MKGLSKQLSVVIALTISFSWWEPISSQTNSTFEQRRQKFLSENGSGFEHCGQSIWAWLENNDQSKAAQIHDIIQSWGTQRDFEQWKNAPGSYCYAWRTGWDVTSIFLLRILYQYPDRISSSDKASIEQIYDSAIRSKYFFHGGSANNRVFDFVARYIYSERHPTIEVQYNDLKDPWLDTFSYGGRSYSPGGTYNSLQLAKDWLFWRFDKFVSSGDEELDGVYTSTFVTSLYTLYDFAQDAEVKKRAKMMLDLILLDSILDVSANTHGGFLGRTYGDELIRGAPDIYHWPYWGIGREPTSAGWGNFYDVYVSSYRVPAIIEDVGILDDEPESYWHLNKENNRAGYVPPTLGKWNYVTKFYNLGGSTYGWMLNVKTNDSYNKVAIRVWVDDLPAIPPPVPGQEYYISYGKNGYQYKNAMLIKVGTPYLHIVGAGNVFDTDETQPNWRFLREDNVALALKLSSGTSALEVAIIGLDYSSYDAFKKAIIANAQVSDGTFRTSGGNVISAEYDPGLQTYLARVNGNLIWHFPFKRLDVEAYNETKIVDWKDNVATIQWHGRKLVYDFNKWTYSDEDRGIPADVDPPTPPQGVRVNPGD